MSDITNEKIKQVIKDHEKEKNLNKEFYLHHNQRITDLETKVHKANNINEQTQYLNSIFTKDILKRIKELEKAENETLDTLQNIIKRLGRLEDILKNAPANDELNIQEKTYWVEQFEKLTNRIEYIEYRLGEEPNTREESNTREEPNTLEEIRFCCPKCGLVNKATLNREVEKDDIIDFICKLAHCKHNYSIVFKSVIVPQLRRI